MSFETQHGLKTDGLAGPQVWTDLLQATSTGTTDPQPYGYVSVSKTHPETTTVYQNGSVAYSTLANTGVAAAPTATGTFPVYARYKVTTMTRDKPGRVALRRPRHPVGQLLQRRRRPARLRPRQLRLPAERRLRRDAAGQRRSRLADDADRHARHRRLTAAPEPGRLNRSGAQPSSAAAASVAACSMSGWTSPSSRNVRSRLAGRRPARPASRAARRRRGSRTARARPARCRRRAAARHPPSGRNRRRRTGPSTTRTTRSSDGLRSGRRPRRRPGRRPGPGRSARRQAPRSRPGVPAGPCRRDDRPVRTHCGRTTGSWRRRCRRRRGVARPARPAPRRVAGARGSRARRRARTRRRRMAGRARGRRGGRSRAHRARRARPRTD